MSARTTASAVITTAVITALVATSSSEPGIGTVPDQHSRSLIFYGGTVRSTATGWIIVDDTTHDPLGLAAVTCSPATGNLTVTLDEPGSRVVSSYADSDETYSRAGIVSGVSAGLDRLVIRYTRAGAPLPCTSPLLRSTTGNTWIGGIMLPATST